MVRPWRDLAAGADAVVDAQFGEVVQLIPMMRVDGSEEPTRDPNRQSIECIAVFVTSGDQVLGLAGDHAGTPLIGRIAVGELFLSIAESELGTFEPRQGDHVVLTERGGDTLEINRIPPNATGRIKMALVELPG